MVVFLWSEDLSARDLGSFTCRRVWMRGSGGLHVFVYFFSLRAEVFYLGSLVYAWQRPQVAR
jgi:hypothetical protein